MIGAALALSALLASCGGGGSTPTPTTYAVGGTLTTLNANATSEANFFGPWAGGAGTIQAKAGSTGTALASGTVAADGNFSVTLPATIAGSDLEAVGEGQVDLGDENCTGSVTVSNTGALGTAVFFSVDSVSSDGEASPADLRLIYSGSTPVGLAATGGGLLYVNAATTISGQQTCVIDGAKLTTSINVSLQAGYNRFNAVITVKADGSGSLDISSGDWPSRWVVSDTSALPLSLNKSNTVRRLLERQAEKLIPWN